jgi:hypothetical protein
MNYCNSLKSYPKIEQERILLNQTHFAGHIITMIQTQRTQKEEKININK